MNSPADLSRDRPRKSPGNFWDRQLRARLGQDLRSIFETSLNEPLPEHLSSLLFQMEVAARPEAAPVADDRSRGRDSGP